MLLYKIAGLFHLALVNCPPGQTGSNCDTNFYEVKADPSAVIKIAQLSFGVIGALALIFVIIGGIKFVMSQGEPQAVASARQTIIFAVIGLIIAVSAEAIVTFVLGRL